MLSASLRKAALLTHISSSVGWMGSVAAFFIMALTSAYSGMSPVTWWVIVPFAWVSLGSGLILALGTKWGLIRHRWVFTKLLINAVCIVLLMLHTRLIDHAPTANHGDRVHLVVASGLALVALLTATILSVYKPRF